MGCGASKNGGGEVDKKKGTVDQDTRARKQSILLEIPEIKVVSGEAVTLTSLPRVIFIFGTVFESCKTTCTVGFFFPAVLIARVDCKKLHELQ